MNKNAIIISALTAFIITGGGVIVGVTGSGYSLNTTSWVVAGIFGLMAAAKDVRSLLKLPPVDSVNPPAPPSRLPLLLLIGSLMIGVAGCATQKLAEGGAYAKSATSADMPELFLLDSSFDVAYAGLDLTFKFERDNRKLLWAISPDIKHSLDKLRLEAGQVNQDYALARQTYLDNPIPANLDVATESLSRLTALNASALTVIQTKGTQ